jgi:hypothetical protein
VMVGEITMVLAMVMGMVMEPAMNLANKSYKSSGYVYG